jgi:MoaD family protein
VKIKYFAIFRKVTNKKEEELEIKEGSTVKDLLEALSERYGKRFKDLIFDEKTGSLSGHLLLLSDGVNASSSNILETKRWQRLCNFTSFI